MFQWLKEHFKKKKHGHSCESQSVNEQMDSKNKWIQKMSPFLGPAGTGMGHFKRGTVSAVTWSRKGQEDRWRVKVSGGIAVCWVLVWSPRVWGMLGLQQSFLVEFLYQAFEFATYLQSQKLPHTPTLPHRRETGVHFCNRMMVNISYQDT